MPGIRCKPLLGVHVTAEFQTPPTAPATCDDFQKALKDWLSCNPHPLSLLGPSTGRDQPLLLKPSVRVPRSYSLQFRILYFVLYWRLIRLDFPAAMTLPPKSP